MIICDVNSSLFKYMASLCAKGNNKGVSAKNGGGKLKNKPMALLDLDNSDDEDDKDDEGIMEKEKKFLGELQKALSKCQLCGPTKSCKIGKTGQHVRLTFNQLHGWPTAMVVSSCAIHCS